MGWKCATCGSSNILRDAVAEYDPATRTWEVASLLDNIWCENCLQSDPDCEDEGDPIFEEE